MDPRVKPEDDGVSEKMWILKQVQDDERHSKGIPREWVKDIIAQAR